MCELERMNRTRGSVYIFLIFSYIFSDYRQLMTVL